MTCTDDSPFGQQQGTITLSKESLATFIDEMGELYNKSPNHSVIYLTIGQWEWFVRNIMKHSASNKSLQDRIDELEAELEKARGRKKA